MAEYHEPEDELSDHIRDCHRALVSFKEEIEAVDWYNQRWAASKDETLRAVLAHNRDEEIEHACMNLEWLRRNMPKWDEVMRTYLFTTAPITEIEEAVTGGSEPSEGQADADAAGPPPSRPGAGGRKGAGLGIAGLKRGQ